MKSLLEVIKINKGNIDKVQINKDLDSDFTIGEYFTYGNVKYQYAGKVNDKNCFIRFDDKLKKYSKENKNNGNNEHIPSYNDISQIGKNIKNDFKNFNIQPFMSIWTSTQRSSSSYRVVFFSNNGYLNLDEEPKIGLNHTIYMLDY